MAYLKMIWFIKHLKLKKRKMFWYLLCLIQLWNLGNWWKFQRVTTFLQNLYPIHFDESQDFWVRNRKVLYWNKNIPGLAMHLVPSEKKNPLDWLVLVLIFTSSFDDHLILPFGDILSEKCECLHWLPLEMMTFLALLMEAFPKKGNLRNWCISKYKRISKKLRAIKWRF